MQRAYTSISRLGFQEVQGLKERHHGRDGWLQVVRHRPPLSLQCKPLVDLISLYARTYQAFLEGICQTMRQNPRGPSCSCMHSAPARSPYERDQ